MIDGRRVLGLVPARGGSRGVPGKNIVPLGGKPLVAWTAEAAAGSRYLDRTILSSDDEAIIAAGHAAGLEVPFVRPAGLARHDTPAMDVVLHALDAVDEAFDLLVLLQPTSPLRTSIDIDACIERVVAGAPCCVSVTAPGHSPAWMFTLGHGDRLDRLIPEMDLPARRQELPPVFALNGAVYAADVTWLRRELSFVAAGTVGYAMPADRSVDLDDDLDLALLEVLVARRQGG
jgi:CMP-N,N'-diacetyllegionaminic acid synthase